MTMKIYHNPRCSKSRQTLELLQNKGHNPEVVEYLKHPLGEAALARIAMKLPKGAQRLYREKDAKKLGINISGLSHEAIIEMIAADPKLMERPIVETETDARIGRPPEDILEIL